MKDKILGMKYKHKELLAAIAKVESDFRPWAGRYETNYGWITSDTKRLAKENGITERTEIIWQKTSWGLCQIMGGTARDLGFEGLLSELLDPDLNLKYAMKLIDQLFARGYKEDQVISAYNAGAAKYNETGKFVNQKYVDKVKKAKSSLKKKVKKDEDKPE